MSGRGEGEEKGKSLRILLTGGGTGGHLFPAIAVAEEFQRRFEGTEVLFIGTKRKLDSESLSRYGFTCKTIESAGIKGKNPVQLFLTALRLPLGFMQAVKIIRTFRPQIVLGVGGYVTAPVLLAAKICGKAVVIHEQNSIAGLVNRKLARIADRVCLSLPNSAESFSPAVQKKLVSTGNPVRKNIVQAVESVAKNRAEKQFPTILILGGSQGAHRLNTLVPQALSQIAGAKDGLHVIHQTGKNDAEPVKETYAELAIEAEVFPFIEDMAAVYKKADLVISRGGATTLTELAVLGKPAIIVPYPYAADNHQQKNGEYYAGGGGAEQYIEADLTAEFLAERVGSLLAEPSKLSEMGQAMRRLAAPNAAGKIVDLCLELCAR